MNGYCGYADKPSCEALAATGISGGEIVLLVVIAVALIGLGIAAIARKRGNW